MHLERDLPVINRAKIEAKMEALSYVSLCSPTMKYIQIGDDLYLKMCISVKKACHSNHFIPNIFKLVKHINLDVLLISYNMDFFIM